MADKRFIGKTKDGKYPDQIEIGLQQKDIDLLQANLSEKGWVNIRINKGKDSGKLYSEVV
jgi:predicted transcriptional regulator